MPAEELPLYTHWERVLDDLLDRTMKFPKAVRFTLSGRIDNLALDILEHLVGLHQTWACGFLQTHDLLFRPIFVFVIIELHTRRVLRASVTRSPSDQWTAQQLRNVLLDHDAPRFMIRDNDDKFGASFQAIADDECMAILRTPVRAPRANAFCERFLGSLRRECLDHILILSEDHLRRTVAAYVGYHNECRPHQRLAQVIPMNVGSRRKPTSGGEVVATPVLGGLHHDYRRAA